MSENKNQSSGDNVGIVLVALLGVYAFWDLKSEAIMDSFRELYFRNYEFLNLMVFGVITLICFLLYYLIIKKTSKLSKRRDDLSGFRRSGFYSTFMGRTDDGVDLYIDDEKRCSHVQIIGSTGRGKTQSVIVPWVSRNLNNNKSAILIDGKGSMDVVREIEDKLPIRVNVKYFDPENPVFSIRINPLKNGTATQITDRIFKSFDFEDPYYRAIQYDICLMMIRLIKCSEDAVSFKLLHKRFTDETEITTRLITNEVDQELLKSVKDYLKIPKQKRMENISGLVSQISPFATGDFKKFVNGHENLEVDMLELVNSRKTLVCFPLNTLKYQRSAHILGKLILQDLAYSTGVREGLEEIDDVFSVYLDEFSEFVYEGFESFLNKARSAKVALHLSHQSFGDLKKVSPSFAETINTNTNVKVIMGINDPETADFYARHIGTVSDQKKTEQFELSGIFKKKELSTGRMSVRDVESYKVHPNTLKNLSRGRAVVHIPGKDESLTEVMNLARFNKAELWESGWK